MAKPLNETPPQYIRRTATKGGGGLATEAEIQAKIQEDMESLGNVVTDIGDIPGTASARANGVFTDAESAMEYLETGGLVASTDTGDYEPMSFVYLYQRFDAVLDCLVWEVYIDQDT